MGSHLNIIIVDNFDMPILITTGSKDSWIYPTSEWQETSIGNIDIYDLTIRDDLFLIDTREIVSQ